jgi:DNA-binding MarR family transcriptional regulator
MLAMARRSWVDSMTRRLDELGYSGYRKTDSAIMRTLLRSPVAVGRLGAGLGVTRQAARKLAGTLEQRGLATLERDAHDSRQLNIVLTPRGRQYAHTVVSVIQELNREVGELVSAEQLRGADAVLRAVIGDNRPWAYFSQRLAPSTQFWGPV